jgi:predicted transcriptional regulator
VRVEPESRYWEGQSRRLKELEKTRRAGRHPRVHGTELVFDSLTDMARALTPKRLEVLRLIRRHSPSSLRELATLAGRDVKNVVADVNALRTLGLIEADDERGQRYRRAPRTGFGRIEVSVEL